jgi:hypothetical protein
MKSRTTVSAVLIVLLATIVWAHTDEKKTFCPKGQEKACCAKAAEKGCCGECSKNQEQKKEEMQCCGICSSSNPKSCSKSCGVCFSQFKPEQWSLTGVDYEVIDFKGKKALHIKKPDMQAKNDGVTALLKKLEFDNGTIEFDMASKIFSGVVFRVQNSDKAECVYFRPFNSGTKKHENTVQYVARGTENTWQYLRKNFPGTYEAGADLKELEWFHVKLEVCCSSLNVFINDATKPCLVVKDLKHGQCQGAVGLWAWDGYFANLKVTPKAS